VVRGFWWGLGGHGCCGSSGVGVHDRGGVAESSARDAGSISSLRLCIAGALQTDTGFGGSWSGGCRSRRGVGISGEAGARGSVAGSRALSFASRRFLPSTVKRTCGEDVWRVINGARRQFATYGSSPGGISLAQHLPPRTVTAVPEETLSGPAALTHFGDQSFGHRQRSAEYLKEREGKHEAPTWPHHTASCCCCLSRSDHQCLLSGSGLGNCVR
jgi:hypothetical protein